MDDEALAEVEQRVLWLATAIVDRANRRPNPSGIKVGGHQASSASLVSIMTALWLRCLQPGDRVSVKPHASPVLYALQHLLGRLDAPALETLRAYGGLQSYPSRTKQPELADFSTGSVGIGATATIWAALAARYLDRHEWAPARRGRQIALLGDAELDEGPVWEAVIDPTTAQLGEVVWIVDVNRQSLDRIVPELHVGRLIGMFESAGWEVRTLKWGRRIQGLFDRPGGADLRRRLELMPNEEYQAMLRAPHEDRGSRLLDTDGDTGQLARLVEEIKPAELGAAIEDLAGHDLGQVVEAVEGASADRPTVVFAYTIKGWHLPIAGHPSNHSTLLDDDQLRALAAELGADPDDPWAPLPEGSAGAEACRAAAERLTRPAVPEVAAPEPPADLGRPHKGRVSTQAALGRLLLDLSRERPATADRVVTVSPDVATSTNLAGWINKVGVWQPTDHRDWFDADTQRLVRWTERRGGQHVELGIAEVNLVGLLAELGATWSRHGQPLIPIGTIYDPFVSRALEPWAFGVYAGGQSILVGTPSGITLGPEGGAHQSIGTPGIGIQQPGVTYYEPAFAQDLEWCLLAAMAGVGHAGGASYYFRLSTRPLDQGLAPVPRDHAEREARRADAIAGAYRLVDRGERTALTVAAVGALVPEALEAAGALEADGAGQVSVVVITSPDLLFRSWQADRGLDAGPAGLAGRVFPAERPIVAVMDGHPHSLAWLAGVGPATSLGVTDFGQSGAIEDLYPRYGIDADTIAGAAWDLLDA
jgi:pyruvate dehydrogenase E1 component